MMNMKNLYISAPVLNHIAHNRETHRIDPGNILCEKLCFYCVYVVQATFYVKNYVSIVPMWFKQHSM